MALRDLMLRAALRPKLVDSAPGSLRVHIMALKRVPEDLAQHAAELVRILTGGHPHVNDIEVDLPAGNVAVRYNAEQTEEREVMDFITRVLDVVRAEWAALKDKPLEEIMAWARTEAARLADADS